MSRSLPHPLRLCRPFGAVVLAACLTVTTPEVSAQVTARPVEDVLSYADLLFSKEQFALAAQQYQTFIRERPDSPNLQAAWFRLGECYLKVNQVNDAVTTFNFLVNQYKRGAFVGSAAYRLAVLRFNEKDYRNAVAFFKVAKDELEDPAAKLQAQFYFARSLQLTSQAREALANYEQVLAAKPAAENPFHERGLLESARLLYDLGDKEKAMVRFQTLATSATTPEFKEEAIVRAGLLAAESGQPDLSETLLGEALKFSADSPWKALAQTGAIFNAFSRGEHERVIALYNTGQTDANQNESRAKMLLVVGHSFRIQGDLESALRLYSLVEAKYPNDPEGIEAGYRKLQLLHQQENPSLPAAAKAFAEKQRRIDPNSSFIDMAWLMAAEWHFAQAENSASGSGSEFAKKHYGDAAANYRKVRPDKVDQKYEEARLYKQGWAEIESDNSNEGIMTLSRFIQQHSDSALASSALAKRAMAYQAQEDHKFALGDYLDIAKRYPDSPELEFSLQQIALIYAHLREIPEMIQAYKNLLAKFPETDGAGEAHYWIGVGQFDTEEFLAAIDSLKKARELDSTLDDKATFRIAIAHYQLDQVDELAVEAKRYLEAAPAEPAAEGPARTELPPQVLEHLGREMFQATRHEEAEFFLTALTDPENPEKTAASVWRILGQARAKLKKHQDAIAAFDQFLLQTERPSERAAAYLDRGVAQLCLGDHDAARNSAQESLRSQKEGRTNAEARLLLGDISAAAGNLSEAVKDYLVVSQIFMDPEITPKALTKAINAYRTLGDQAKAQELTQELSRSYPGYKAPASLDKEC